MCVYRRVDVIVCVCGCVSGCVCVTVCASVRYDGAVPCGRHVAEQPLPEPASLSLGEGVAKRPPWARSAYRNVKHVCLRPGS